MAAAPADAAWARAVGRLQSAVAGLEGAFGAAAAGAAAECSAQAFPGEVARLDLEIVQAAGDGALLEELAFELAARSLSACVVPCFWACVPGGAAGAASAESAELEPGWQERLRRAFAALLRLHLGHCELLRALGTPGAGRLVGAYRAAFRAELTESWPPWASERLRLYFGSTWRPFARSRARPGEQRYQSEEWWWAISSGDQATAPSRPPRRRVLELLEASRRPVRGGAPGCGQDAVMGDACPPGRWLAGDGEGSGGEEDEAMFSEADSDASSADADAAVDDDPRQPTASSVEGLRGMAVSFQRMGLGDIWRDLAVQFAVDQLASTVEERCRGRYEAHGLLDRLAAWLHDALLRWLRAAHGLEVVAPRHLPAGEAEGGECPLRAEDAWWGAARHLVFQLFQAFADLRIGEAFDMLKEFPDSAPALTDLRRCLARTGRATLLVRSLREQLTRRLLIAGARTHDVIGVYVKTIRAMRLVDPRGLLLEAVSDPIRAYLKRRKDTVRCIITALTEDSDLLLELRAEVARAPTSGGVAGSAMGAAVAGAGAAAGSAVGPGEGTAGSAAHPVPAAVMPPLEPPEMSFGNADFDVSEDEEDPDAWTPDPIDADPLIPSRQRSVQDVISLLVGIYGSKEMFIKEYKEMLADRLLETSSYSTEREAHNLELLKTRFGETALGHCEVMLQDIKDSKRLNANVQQCTDLRPTTAPAVGSSAGAALRPPTRAEAASGTPAAGSRPPVAPFRLSSAIALAAAQDSPAGEAQASPPALGASRGGRAEDGGCAEAGDGGGAPGRLPLAQMQALVLSQHYWPSVLSKADNPQLKLPPTLEEALADYASAFAKVKANRAISWKKSLGLVEVSVQLADRTLNVEVTPVQVAILECFSSGDADMDTPGAGSPAAAGQAQASRRSLQEVAAQLQLPEQLVRKRIGFWVAKGVLREVSAGVFETQESLSAADGARHAGGGHLDEDGERSPEQSAARAAAGGCACAAEVEACEAFIQGMLTHWTSLPLGRIHNFLQMFMVDPLYTHSEAQLQSLLARLCQDGRLEFNGSDYLLVKAT